MKPQTSFRVGLALCAAALVAHALALGYESDDAYISFRYARNLLDGHGLVYNAGERVEGYTNFLWTMLLAGADAIVPGARMPSIATALGLALGAATVVLTGLLGREAADRTSPWLLLAPALVAADTSFAVWTTGGLEGPLFASLLVGAALAYVRWTKGRGRAEWAPLLLALASITRPEGAVLFAAFAAFELLRERHGLVRVLRWSWPFAAIFVPCFAWRWSYYDWPFPNTFYAKVGGGPEAWERGVRYLGRFLLSHAWFLAPVPLALFLRPRIQGWAILLGLLVAAYTAFIVAAGGDGLFQYRFCAHVVPLFYVIAQAGLADLLARAPRWLVAIVAALALLLTAQTTVRTLLLPDTLRWSEPKSEVSFPDPAHGYRFFDNYFVARQRIAAEWIERDGRPGTTIASTPAGAIAYFSSHPVIDMLGLADEHIAHASVEGMGRGRAGHEKGDGAYVLSRKPEYVLLGNVAVLARPLSEAEMPSKLVHRSEHEIWADPAFHRDYELVTVRLAESGLFQWFTFWRRRADAPK